MKDNNVRLELIFDADQITKSLDYRFTLDGNDIYKKSGRCAGTFHFPKDGKILVDVIGMARKSDEMQFSVTDFTLASISTLLPGRAPLSLFDRKSACVSITSWGEADRTTDAADDIVRTKVSAREPLSIVADDGQWEVSGYLSVEISMRAKDRKVVTMHRLFYFDPESTVGTGGDVSI